ncbi:MAG: dihydrodipicolinate synthase family protein, partial [Ardenticatenaceae bacterium]
MAEYTKSEAMDWARENLRGQWTTVMTPFTPDDEVDEDGLRRNIRHIRALGTQGGGFTWGMGEFWALTREERMRIYDIATDEVKGEWPIAAHVSDTSYKDMVALAEHAEEVGFDLLIVAAPYFVTKTEQQVVDFVKILADSTNLAIMFYNSPQFGIVMSARGLKQICDIPGVVGVKEASFNKDLSLETHQLLGKTAIISTPDEWIFFAGKDMGFEQQVMFANTSDWRFDRPGQNYYNQFVDKVMRGDLDEGFYNAHVKPIKEVSDKWWAYTVKKANGALPAPMCKYWGEL